MSRVSRWCLAALVPTLVCGGALLAQVEEDQLGVPTEIEKAYKSQGDILKALISPSLTKGEKDNLDIAAKYLVLRVTWLESLAAAPTDPKNVGNVVKEFEYQYTNRALKDKRADPKAVEFFNSKITECLKAIFDRKFESNRISTLNAAQMLPIVARSKSPEFGRYLLGLVKDPGRHDAIKLFALRGLREYSSVKIFPQVFETRKVKEMAPELDRVQILTDYIERKAPENLSKEEAGAVGYLRREAVQALAQVQVPAVIVDKGGKIEGPVAVTLLKVLAKGQLEPTPTLAEKCEAAIALCNMNAKEVGDYDPQLATYAIGLTLSEFINAYRADFNNFSAKNKAPVMPWKIYADRLRLAIDSLAKETASSPASASAKNFQVNAKAMLENIYQHKAVDNPSAVDFTRAVNKAKPSTKKVFKSKAEELDLGY